MEELIVYGIVVGLVLLLFVFYFYGAHRKNQKTKAKIADEYGKPPVWTMDERDFTSIKRYYEKVKSKEPEIDDITWSDLNMDAVFKRMKNTQSSIGDEYSYRFFRRQHNSDLGHFEDSVREMQADSETRQKLQFAFSKIGRKTDNGLIELLMKPESFPKIPLLLISLITAAGIGSLIWLAFNIDHGILAVILCFSTSLILFGAVLRKIHKPMVVLGMFTHMVQTAKQIVKLDSIAFKQERELLQKNLKFFSRITRLVDFIVEISGSADSIMIVLTSYFGLYGFAYSAMVAMFQKYRKEALEMYEIIGYMELCISVASYRDSLDYYCRPEFTDTDRIDFDEIIHPLLKKPVANSHNIGNKIMITGSNASGKSTFARTLAVNVVMGQLFNTCLAKSFSFRRCEVYTSMNLKDDITTGDSFYMAEVKSLKRLLKVAGEPGYPMLFTDEIFKGTNIVERIAAASVILKRFADADCFICISTHDIELSCILEKYYENFHFKETVTGDDILFDYTLYDGVTTGSNAIKLLSYCHYDKDIVTSAEAKAEEFRETGEWKQM